MAWTDGRLHGHAGCVEPDEGDVEFRGLDDPGQYGESVIRDASAPLYLPPRRR